MNKCKDCIHSEHFKDPYNGKDRYGCTIGQSIIVGFGDTQLIVDGECDKFKLNAVEWLLEIVDHIDEILKENTDGSNNN